MYLFCGSKANFGTTLWQWNCYFLVSTRRENGFFLKFKSNLRYFRKQIRFSIIIVWLFENWVDRNVILLKVETFLKTNKSQHHHNVSVWKLDWPKLSRFLQSICLYVCLGFCLFKSPTSRTLVELNCVTEGQPRLPPKYQVRQSHEQKVENSSHNHSLVRLQPFL